MGSRILAVVLAWGAMIGFRSALALDLTAGSAVSADCTGAIPSFRASASTYLEPAPVLSATDYGDGRYAPSAGTNIGFGAGFAEVSAGLGSYCLGILYREEFEATATKDLLDVLVGNHYGNTFSSGRRYQLAYQLNMLSAGGLRLRRTFLLSTTRSWRITLGAGISLLKGLKGRDESFNGAVTATSADYAIGTATWSRIGSDLSLSSFNPFVGAGDVSGWGFSDDIDLKAQSRGGTVAEFIVMDAFGRMFWNDIRSAVWNLNNSSIRYNANFNRDAFVTGVDSRINHSQDIPSKFRVAVTQPLGGHLSALVSDDWLEGYHFPEAGVRYGADKCNTAVSYDIRTKAVSLSVRWLAISVSLTTNRLPISEATALGLSIDVNHYW